MHGPRIVEKPWGYEHLWAVTDQYVGKLLHVRKGHRLSLQFHREKDESCYLMYGRVRLLKGPTVDQLTAQELGPGAYWRNQPGELHWLEALQDSDILEASTHQLDDVVRVRDDYGRVDGSQGSTVSGHGRPVGNPRHYFRAEPTADGFLIRDGALPGRCYTLLHGEEVPTLHGKPVTNRLMLTRIETALAELEERNPAAPSEPVTVAANGHWGNEP
jgi:quercetin dioxygenase-like cupin family protein